MTRRLSQNMINEPVEHSKDAVETTVRNCYSTWGRSYYGEYYGPAAPYPPVHLDLVKSLLQQIGAHRVLDAGCGPASMMRHILQPGIELYGFDLTPEMIVEAQSVLAALGLAGDRVWEGSVLNRADYITRTDGRAEFDCVISCGVLPHIPEPHDVTVIENVRASLRPGGYALVEARNELFALFTLNRYSCQFFFERLIPVEALNNRGVEQPELKQALEQVRSMFRTDLPPVRQGKASEPGYDEVLSRTHNPLVLSKQFEDAGFEDVRLFFYHFHSLPPMVGGLVPNLFRQTSLEMEQEPENWRGLFMASAFFVLARRP
jgi:2-polyprenyl-3-methyl-5-hydroxy-6-metoxy-1,4-benzoquinol methylase